MNEIVAANGTVIADPPWPYTTKITDKRIRGFSGEHYRAMSIQQLAELKCSQLGSHLFLWTTVAYTEDAFKLVRAWGFKPITMMFWVKAKMLTPFVGEPLGFVPNYGTGHWFRGAVEPIIVAKKPNVSSVRSPYLGLISPNMRHSMKPTELHQLVESVKYPAPYIELFAREQRPNWVCMGNAISGKDIVKDIASYLGAKGDAGTS
jgi:N6-adenosine-specific RNA methylase IME4